MPLYEPLENEEPTSGEGKIPSPEGVATSEGGSKHDLNEEFSDQARAARIQLAMMEVLEGSVSSGRAKKYWENLKLKPVHVQMLLMKAAGSSNRAIAQQLGFAESRVSVIVNHPDAMFLLGVLVSAQAEVLLDVKTRIKAHAGEALDTVLHVMRHGEAKDRLKAGFGLLDRAGYGAVQKSESTHRFEMPAKEANNLVSAMRESSELDDIEEADWSEIERQGAGPLEQEELVTPVGLGGGTGDPGTKSTQVDEEIGSEPPSTGHLVPSLSRRIA
jgi:hypothetical protein